MTERELRRTALVIPPKGRAVLCIWAAAAGLFLAPFAFWQSVPAGAVFCLLWAVLTALLRARACSYAAVLGEHTLTIYAGIAFPVRRVVPRRAVTGIWPTSCSPSRPPACTGPKAASGRRWGCWGPTAFPRWRSFCWPSGRRSRARTAMSWPLRRSTFWPGWRRGGCPPVRPGCWPSPAFCWG